jgi:hypothetical protein
VTRDPCSAARGKKERRAREQDGSYNRNWNDAHEGFLVASGSGNESVTARGGRVASVGWTS